MAIFFGSQPRVTCRMVRIILPNAGDCGTALRTASMVQAVLGDIVPGAPDEQRATVGAACVRTIAVDVPFVYVMQPSILRNLPRAVERFRRCSRFVAKLEVRMKGGEM